MGRFVFSYVSFFDNVLHQEIIEANSIREAILKSPLSWCVKENESYEDAQARAFDGDCVFSVLRID